jgi:hypothetical protein
MAQPIKLCGDLGIESQHVVLVARERLDCVDERRARGIKRWVRQVELEIQAESASSFDLVLGCEDRGVRDMVQRAEFITVALQRGSIQI